MDREDILNLYVVTNLPLLRGATSEADVTEEDEFSF